MVKEVDFNLALSANSWKRVSDSHPVKLYYGKDENSRNAIEYTGNFEINRKIRSSVLIEITHYKNTDNSKSIVFSLLDKNLLRPFCDFLNSLIDATELSCITEQEAYKNICEVYFIMQKMFRSSTDILKESEIKGLLGELLFLQNSLIPSVGATKALNAWSGAEKTRKDFALDTEWYEIKTIDFGKDTVHISSIEQLDSHLDGKLVIYQVERMAEEFDGLSLNKLVHSLLEKLESINDKDCFISKLQDAGYTFHPKYDEYVYQLRCMDMYLVNSSFPKITRNAIPNAIAKASFDIIISEINSFKI